MSSNNSEFSRKKKLLLDVLKNYTNKLLFPTQTFEVLKTGGINNYLSTFMEKYNDSLKKLRSLELELEELTKFGMISNSEYVWETSIKWNIGKYEAIKKSIVESCTGTSSMEKILLSQCKITPQSIYLFMTLIKENGKYMMKLKNSTRNYEKEYSREVTLKLLP